MQSPLTAPSAFVAAVEPHRPEIERQCLGRLRSTHDAQDATQETLLRAWRSRERFRGEASVGAWLYRIAANVCTDLARRESTARSRDSAPERLELAGGQAADPGEGLIARQTAELALLHALRLPRRQRGALVLNGMMGWSAQEAGALLDTTTASVNSALQRARRTLSAQDLDRIIGAAPTARERALARAYTEAIERGDTDAFLELLALEPQSRDAGVGDEPRLSRVAERPRRRAPGEAERR